jgi:hypothetical protein
MGSIDRFAVQKVILKVQNGMEKSYLPRQRNTILFYKLRNIQQLGDVSVSPTLHPARNMYLQRCSRYSRSGLLLVFQTISNHSMFMNCGGDG